MADRVAGTLGEVVGEVEDIGRAEGVEPLGLVEHDDVRVRLRRVRHGRGQRGLRRHGGRLVVAIAVDDPDRAAALYDTTSLLIRASAGGIELVGGLWIGLVSLAALRVGVLSPWLNRIGMATGIAGVATTTLVAPEIVTSVFGAGSIVWFTWLGLHLVRGARGDVTDSP